MSTIHIANRVRQNHALEHATIHILSRRNPFLRVMGRSTPTGFYLYGVSDTQEVADSVAEALERLQQGEAQLAVHPRCGTNLAVTGILAGMAAFGATLGHARSKFDRLPLAVMAATIGAIVAQPLAYRVQEQITTNPEVDGLRIEQVTRQEQGKMIVHKVVIGQD